MDNQRQYWRGLMDSLSSFGVIPKKMSPTEFCFHTKTAKAGDPGILKMLAERLGVCLERVKDGSTLGDPFSSDLCFKLKETQNNVSLSIPEYAPLRGQQQQHSQPPRRIAHQNATHGQMSKPNVEVPSTSTPRRPTSTLETMRKDFTKKMGPVPIVRATTGEALKRRTPTEIADPSVRKKSCPRLPGPPPRVAATSSTSAPAVATHASANTSEGENEARPASSPSYEAIVDETIGFLNKQVARLSTIKSEVNSKSKPIPSISQTQTSPTNELSFPEFTASDLGFMLPLPQGGTDDNILDQFL